MAELNAIMTEDGRLFWANLFANIVGYRVPVLPATPGWNPILTHFRIGEGGWEDLGAGAVPRALDGTLRHVAGAPAPFTLEQDLDAAIDVYRTTGVRYAPSSRFVFEKALLGLALAIEAPATIRVRCKLELADANNDGFGNNPEFWEIGLFSAHPTNLAPGAKLMVAYATMPKETKHAGKIIENVLRIKF